jgi:hypothetical protein
MPRNKAGVKCGMFWWRLGEFLSEWIHICLCGTTFLLGIFCWCCSPMFKSGNDGKSACSSLKPPGVSAVTYMCSIPCCPQNSNVHASTPISLLKISTFMAWVPTFPPQHSHVHCSNPNLFILNPCFSCVKNPYF